jgi:cell wall-associated NlpC family hydrolase
MITNAIIGLIIILGSYTLLNTINPDLVNLNLGIKKVSIENFGISEDPELSGTTDLTVVPGDVVCPKSGGSVKIPDIVKSMAGKITYRWGAYGQSPPYINTGWNTAYDDGGYKDNCPTGTICLDCAGFTNYVLKCAGITPPQTSSAFNSGYGSYGLEEVKTMTLEGENVVINGIKLNPGDIIGWPTTVAASLGHSWGHVFVYYGDNMAAESTGTVGWPAGGSMKTFSVTTGQYKNSIKGVLRSGS